MARLELLVARYKAHIGAPWQKNLAGPQKTVFVVYPKTDERRLRARLDEFAMATRDAGHRWVQCDLTRLFANWMAATRYRDEYFLEPSDLAVKLETDFLAFAANHVKEILRSQDVDDDTVVAVYGAASLFGFTRVSLVLKEVEHEIRGRLVLFFPGEYEDRNFFLLDVRDGWNYLAVPITLDAGEEQ
jgi:hypothetical protein